MSHSHEWKPGPLPPGTYNWGAVVLVGQESQGFYFADFYGDHVKIQGDYGTFNRVVNPDEIALWTNCIELPPNVRGRA